jgi:hypothetical protein
MIHIAEKNGRITIEAGDIELLPRHESQLSFWGFAPGVTIGNFEGVTVDAAGLTAKLVAYLHRDGFHVVLDAETQAMMNVRALAATSVCGAIERGRDFKAGNVDCGSFNTFQEFLARHIARNLKDHQYKAALHLLATENGANFSVPGSGKTTVVLARIIHNTLRKSAVC